MALNLLRNSRVFYTTKLNSSGQVDTSGHTTATTREIQVLDGFSFSQNTGQETITVNEAGAAPVRGQRSFNTSLEPVDFSFSTYIRPKYNEGGTTTAGPDANDTVDAEEYVLWNSMSSVTGNGWTQTSGVAGSPGTAPYSTVSFANSNAHQLQAFGLIIQFEDVTYVIDNCALDSATIDFGLDAIAAIAWAGKGTVMRQLPTALTITGTSGTGSVTGGGWTGTNDFQLKDTSARYIANKLSTMTLAASAFGGLSATSYANIAITGGNITISNNLTYLTPANLGVVNIPITYFTGTRSVTANVTAYLKTGSGTSAELLKDMLNASQSSTANKFEAVIKVGGNNDTRFEITMPTTQLTIPAITSEQIIATSITMTAQGSSTGAAGGAYDLEAKNEITLKYYAAA
jgi:hypothetical protein